MHDMQPIAVDDFLAGCVCLSCTCILQKFAEWIKILYGVQVLRPKERVRWGSRCHCGEGGEVKAVLPAML